jgi:hypothetical protein
MEFKFKLVAVAALALMVGSVFAAPLLIAPTNVQPFPQVMEGPKADLSVNVVYADFNPVTWQYQSTDYNSAGVASPGPTYEAVNITYNVVLNVTNLSNQPATVYQLSFAAAQNINVRQSMMGGTIYYGGSAGQSSFDPYYDFGGVVQGVYLNNKWVNETWMPNIYEGANGTGTIVPYPECLYTITEAHYYGGILAGSGPLTPPEIEAYSADHSLNDTVPALPANASATGIWFGGVPITEYYDQYGTPLITEMYVNGAWVDVTGKVTVDNAQPMITMTNPLVNQVMPLAQQPYENMNSSLGAITSLPTWGDWNDGQTYQWFPWNWNQSGFNNTWAPHESRLIMFKDTQMFIIAPAGSVPAAGLEALESGNIQIYASVSNYINNAPVNGVYYNTVSTASQITTLQMTQTSNGYLYNAILGDNQIFQQGTSSIEVTVVPRTTP